MVNPAGVRGDEILAGGDEDEGDESWDPVWEARDRGARRRLERRDADPVQPAPVPQKRGAALGNPARAHHCTPAGGGRLLLHAQERARRHRALRPPHRHPRHRSRPRASSCCRTASRAPSTRPRPETTARRSPTRTADGADYFASLGLDLKYRLASNLTLDATFNPDFGQVEVDPAVVNLTAFETQFDEKRPFFVEGSDIFDFGGAPSCSTRGALAERPAGPRRALRCTRACRTPRRSSALPSSPAAPPAGPLV